MKWYMYRYWSLISDKAPGDLRNSCTRELPFKDRHPHPQLASMTFSSRRGAQASNQASFEAALAGTSAISRMPSPPPEMTCSIEVGGGVNGSRSTSANSPNLLPYNTKTLMMLSARGIPHGQAH